VTAVGFGILALPCVIVRSSFSLKAYALASTTTVIAFFFQLFGAADPPLECFTSGGNRVTNGYELMFPLAFIVLVTLFYIILIFDIAQSIRRPGGMG
jgi:hypothetical protein